jgi:hypothetical protein
MCKPRKYKLPLHFKAPLTLALTLVLLQDAVAIKFFTDPAGFANEQRAYDIKAVAEAVGAHPTFWRNDDRAALMPNGWPFPPFTVSSKGQPLGAWISKFEADSITSMQVPALTHSCFMLFTAFVVLMPSFTAVFVPCLMLAAAVTAVARQCTCRFWGKC